VALVVVLRDSDLAVRRRLLVVLATGAAVLPLVAVAGIVLQGASAGGFGLGEALRLAVVREVLHTRFGEVWAAQAALAAVLAVLAVVSRRHARALAPAAAVAIALLAAPGLSGHAAAEGLGVFVTDLVHVLAAALWVGGLAFLIPALLLAGGRRWELAARTVPRFSALAVVSVAALVVAGTLNAYFEVQAWRALWGTTYGLLVLAKIGLVLPLLALGAYNNRFAVPRLRAGAASPVEQRRFLRTTGVELGLFVVVLAVTAVLVAEPPARAQGARIGSHAAMGSHAMTAPLGRLELELMVDPARAGANTIHISLTDRAGRPATAAEVRVSARLPSRRIGPLRFTARRLAPGDYVVTAAHLALAGDWQILVEARRGEFTLLRASVSVPIRKD
jgi:copper transport protein